MRPVIEMQFGDFIYESVDQLINEAAKLRYRSNGDFNCPMVIRAPIGGGIHGSLYHSQNVEVMFSHVPGLKVIMPATPYDAKVTCPR
jgi:2-oxoisovalerate dehydrogenase E1 component beta subunit